MKILKKVLAGALSLAVIAGAMFAFTGCNKLNGTYAYEGRTYTIITAIEEVEGEDKKVTETRTLTAREYYLYEVKGIALADLATATLTADEEKLFTKWEETQAERFNNVTIEVGGKEVEVVTTRINEITGNGKKGVSRYTYTEKDGVITMEGRQDVGSVAGKEEYDIMTAYIVDGKIETRFYSIDEADDYATGELLYTSIVFAEVK